MAAVSNFEAVRKRLGQSVNQFYAIPRDPPSASKLPIFDAARVRNAMARFNQVQGVSSAEKATAKRKIISAAKKFGIDVNKFSELSGGNIMVDSVKVLSEVESILVDKDELKGKDLEKVLSAIKTVKEIKLEEDKAEEEAPAKEDAPAEEDNGGDEGKGEDAPAEEASEKLAGMLEKKEKELSERTKAYKELSGKAKKAVEELAEIKEGQKEEAIKDLAEKEVKAGFVAKDALDERVSELKGFGDETIEQLSSQVEKASGKPVKATRKSVQTEDLDEGDTKEEGLFAVQLSRDGSSISIKNPSEW